MGRAQPQFTQGEPQMQHTSTAAAYDARISADDDRLQGFSPENVINRLAASGIHLEQSAEARAFHKEIAGAVANVFASPWRWLVWALMGFLR